LLCSQNNLFIFLGRLSIISTIVIPCLCPTSLYHFEHRNILFPSQYDRRPLHHQNTSYTSSLIQINVNGMERLVNFVRRREHRQPSEAKGSSFKSPCFSAPTGKPGLPRFVLRALIVFRYLAPNQANAGLPLAYAKAYQAEARM